MAQRQVKRSSGASREQIVRRYNTRAWYELPDWARQFAVDALPWVVGLMVAILTPAAALAVVLGFHALPLEFIGIPATANDVGLAVVVMLVKFVFLALSLKPLYRHQAKGWNYLILAALVHLLHSIILQHAITGATLFLATLYLYTQVRRQYV